MLLNQIFIAGLLFQLSAALFGHSHSSANLSYAPVSVSCPAQKISRAANGEISDQEKSWLAKRHAKSDPALRDFLKYTAKFSDEEILRSIPSNETINIGLAPSGGSFRAMLTGAGQLAALDNRTAGAFEHGLGGLFQATTYLAGLSGSGWLVGSLAMSDYPSIDEILAQREIWDLEHPFFNLDGLNVGGSMRQWHHIANEVDEKRQAGFNVSMTDYYARALARQLLPASNDYSINVGYSSLRETGAVSDGDMPLPIIQANGRPVEQVITYQNSTVFEMNPFEFGTWDPSGNTFVDMKYLGSTFKDGEAEKCVTNYDNAGFLIGVTSSLFDMVMDDAVMYTAKFKPLSKLLLKLFAPVMKKKEHVAIVEPNPFFQTDNGHSPNLKTAQDLFLVDGGEDQQKIPLIPLVQPKREVDIVFAYDLGAELPHFWPGGSSLTNTYERQFLEIGEGFSVPYVPDDKTMQALNYTHKPVFFGCDARNLTSLRHTPPMIVYTANTEYTYPSNAPTYKFSFSEKDFRGHITNGFETATRGNLTDDSEFATCVGCAVVRRSQERLGVEQTEQCKQCFQRYCWDGTLVN